MIRERTVGKGIPDEISQVLGDDRYAMRYYPDGLSELLLGPYSTDKVSVSRYYLMLDPKVVVDFEPSPLDGKMWCEEKRKFLHERGIVYVPVFLREMLTAQRFRERVEQEREALRQGLQDVRDDAAVDIEAILGSAEMKAYVKEEALARLNAEIAAGRKLYGASRMTRLEAITWDVLAELRRKATDGSLGREYRYRQLAVAAGR